MKLELIRPYCYLDISIGSTKLGRIVIELYEDLAPNAVSNFLNLVNTTKSPNFKGNCFETVLKNFVVRAGTLNNGSVSTINDGQLFGLENPEPIDCAFKVCTANSDPSANGSQFFITTYPQPHLTGKHSVFGRVKHGKSVVRTIERVDTDKTNTPLEKVVIADCGVWEEGDDIPIYNACYDPIGGDIYEEYPEDDENIDKDSSESVYNASIIIKESGTLLYKQGRIQDALLKYTKCLRYVLEYIPDEEQHPEWYTKYYDLKKKLYLNMSLFNLSFKDYKRTIDYCSYLLDMTGLTKQETAKVYYRQGMGNLGVNKPQLAVESFKLALANEPTDKAIQTQLDVAVDLVEQNKQAEKAKYKKFFG